MLISGCIGSVILVAVARFDRSMRNKWKRPSVVRLGLMIMLVFLIFGAIMKEARGWQVKQYLMCKDLTNSLPVDVTNTFTSDDAQAIFWANLTDVPAGLKIRWEWYFPNGSLAIPLETEATQSWVWTLVFAYINIRGYPAANIPGTWTVKFYVEGILQATVPFEITVAIPTVTVTTTALSTRTSTRIMTTVSTTSATQTNTLTVMTTETSKLTVTEISIKISRETTTDTTSVTTEIVRTDVPTLGAVAAVALIVGLFGGALVTRKRR